MEGRTHGRLVNAERELIAEGPCFVNEADGRATLEPTRMPGVIQKERGRLTLELESGRSLAVSDKPMIVRLSEPGGVHNERGRRTVYRLRLIEEAQDATAAGAAGEGAPALRQGGGPFASGQRETPAAR